MFRFTVSLLVVGSIILSVNSFAASSISQQVIASSPIVNTATVNTLLPPQTPPSIANGSNVNTSLPFQPPVNEVTNQTAPTIASPAPVATPAYSVEIPVTGFEDAERQQVFIQALRQVLINASGNPDIINQPSIKAILPNAATLVQTYSYTAHPGPTAASTNFLVVQFDTKGIEELLHKSTQKIWSAKRPTTLMWLAMVYGPLTKSLIDESSNDIIVTTIHKNAENFGMPVVFPTMDLQDTSQVSAADVCNMNGTAITAASNRYGMSAVLVGCVMKPVLGNTWNSRWMLLSKNNKTQWATSGSSVDEVVTQAMLAASQHLGSKHQQANELTPENVVLRITNVNGLAQYTDVVKYLRSMSPVTQVDLLNIEATEILISVNCIGGLQALLTALNAQAKLVPNNSSSLPSGIDLDYRFVGS